MMRKLIFVGVLVLAMSSLALAQDFPKFEVFGGYSFLRSDIGRTPNSIGFYYNSDFTSGIENGHGFEASFTYNLNRWLGIKGDFSTHFGKINYDSLHTNTEEYYNSSGSYTQTRKYTGSAKTRTYNYLFGPEFSHRGKNYRPFAHVLFGLTQTDFYDVGYTEQYWYQYPTYGYSDVYVYSGNAKSTSFAMAVGGGFDITINKKISLRLPQVDYIIPVALREIHGTINEKDYYYDVAPPSGTVTPEYVYKDTSKGTIDRFNNIRISAGLVFKLK